MLVVVSLPFNVFMAYAMFTPVLVLYTPDHRCSLDPALLRQSAEVLALKHESRILGQWSNPVSGPRNSQASSLVAKQHRA